MFSPLPRNKRAKNPHEGETGSAPITKTAPAPSNQETEPAPAQAASPQPNDSFSNNPFAQLDSNRLESSSG
jgi:hypothetical protein